MVMNTINVQHMVIHTLYRYFQHYASALQCQDKKNCVRRAKAAYYDDPVPIMVFSHYHAKVNLGMQKYTQAERETDNASETSKAGTS